MKNTILGLLAATLVASPTLAASWKTELFSRIDANSNGELSVTELQNSGCRVNVKLFRYADVDRTAGLSRAEYFTNRDLFGNCK